MWCDRGNCVVQVLQCNSAGIMKSTILSESRIMGANQCRRQGTSRRRKRFCRRESLSGNSGNTTVAQDDGSHLVNGQGAV